MSNAPGYDRGYSDYKDGRACMVTKTRKGLRFASNDDASLPLAHLREAWGEAYVAGYTQACKDDDGDIPLASKERLRG